MTKRKATRTREKLTWNQIDRLARAIAVELMGENEEAIRMLLLLTQEIAEHPFDHSHVESIVNLLNCHLFAGLVESDIAFKTFIASERQKLAEKGGGS